MGNYLEHYTDEEAERMLKEMDYRTPKRIPQTAYDFPLRPDFMAQLVLPRNLTEVEARRLAAFLCTLVIPDA